MAKSAHREPDGSDAGVIYALADTHLGLNERGPKGHSDQARYLADFLSWLSDVPAQGRRVNCWEGGVLGERTLRPADELVLLGDVLELWNADNDAILFSSLTSGSLLANLRARVVWVLGNHDTSLHSVVGSYPLPHSRLDIVGEVYPGTRKKPGSMKIGRDRYLFLHGHSFDPAFRDVGLLWRILGPSRQFGAALGDYVWGFGALWALALVTQMMTAGPPIGWVLVLALLLLWLPRFYMRVALVAVRNHLSSVRARQSTIRGFARWWRKLGSRAKLPEDIHIVYGHTHFIDAFRPGGASWGPTPTAEEAWLQRELRKYPERPTLLNLPAWVNPGAGREEETTTVFLYVDARGPMFLGWDWQAKQPFHIPFEWVADRRAHRLLDGGQQKIAQLLGWPEPFLRKWAMTRERI